MSFLGPLVPLFWTSGDVSSGVQSQSGFCFIHIFAEANVMYIPRDPPALLHMPTFWWLVRSQPLPHMHGRGGTWLRFEPAITWTEDEGATIVPATRLLNIFFLLFFSGKIYEVTGSFTGLSI